MMLQVRCRLLADASACCQAFLLLYKSSQSLRDASHTEFNLNCTCTSDKLSAARICIFVLQVHTTPVASRDWGNFRQRLLMDFGRIINKHGVQFAYPTQVNTLMTQVALLQVTVTACCFACVSVQADVLRVYRSITASEYLVRPLFSLQYSKLPEPAASHQLSTAASQPNDWFMHECTPPCQLSYDVCVNINHMKR